MRTSTVTVAHLRAVLNSPVESPVLHMDHEGRLDVDPAAYVNHHQVVITLEEITNFFNGDTSEATNEDLEDLLPELQAKADEIAAEQADLDALDTN